MSPTFRRSAPSALLHRLPRHGAVAAHAALVLAGCTPGDGSEAGVLVRDSAGVTIVENLALASTLLPTSPGPLLEIGVVDGAPEYQFGSVTGAARLSDGSIAVADGMARQVHWYGPDGAHALSFGQEGRGPEDFGYPASLFALPGDTVVVQDRMDRVWLDPGGRFVRRHSLDRERWSALWRPNFSEGFTWLPDGQLFAPVYVRSERDAAGQRPSPGPPFRPEMILVRVRGDLSSADTLGRFGGIQQQFVEVGGRPGVMPMVPPHSVNTSFDVGGDGTVAVGDSQHPQVHLFGPDGTHRIVRWGAEPEPLTGAEVEAWKERRRGESWAADQLPLLERGWAGMEVPTHKARFQRVDVARDGALWVALGDYASDPARWLVFDARGRHRGVVSLPGPFRFHDAGAGYLLGVYRDANDVEFVRLYGLDEGASG